jgi:hypothetical protein
MILSLSDIVLILFFISIFIFILYLYIKPKKNRLITDLYLENFDTKMKEIINNTKYNNRYNNIQIFIFSWKKVEQNAIEILNEVSNVFEDTWLINCNEQFNYSSNISINYNNIIFLDNNAYYAKQFDTAIQNSKENTIVGFIVGDIKPGITDWNLMKINIIDSFLNLDIGIYAPYEPRTCWQKSQEKILGTDLYLTDNTDCTAWFLSPHIIKVAKELQISKNIYYGWGIDIVLCNYSITQGLLVVYDKAVKVINPDNTGYSKNKASNEINIIKTIAKHKNFYKDDLKSNIHFVTFANDNFKKTRERIINEAKNMNIFDTVNPFNENSIEIEDFIKEHKNFILNNKRGYGYYIWKPKILIETFKKIKYNDIVIYSDSGCELNKEGIDRLKEYINMAKINDLVVFSLRYKENQYTKKDLLLELDCDNYCSSKNQIMSGVFIIRKCKRMENFLNRWLELSLKNNFNLISDSNSLHDNSNNFIEHRHDQSIFSVLIKTLLKNRVVILENEIDINEPDFIYEYIKNNKKFKVPIIAKRLKY